MTDSEKLKAIISTLKKSRSVRNQQEFNEITGINKSVTSEIVNGKRTLSKQYVHSICTAFPQINSQWLIDGTGDILKYSTGVVRGAAYDQYWAPLLPISAHSGAIKEFLASTNGKDCERIRLPIKNADLVIDIVGESMAPHYEAGTKIAIKKIDATLFLEWGKVYVLDTANGILVKELRPSKEANCVSCVSLNGDQSKYAPFEVCLVDIYGVYCVMLALSFK